MVVLRRVDWYSVGRIIFTENTRVRGFFQSFQIYPQNHTNPALASRWWRICTGQVWAIALVMGLWFFSGGSNSAIAATTTEAAPPPKPNAAEVLKSLTQPKPAPSKPAESKSAESKPAVTKPAVTKPAPSKGPDPKITPPKATPAKTTSNSTTPSKPEPTLGEKVFTANCAACHIGGNNIILAEKNLSKDALAAYAMDSVAAIKIQVTNGKNAMPAFGENLTSAEIEAVARYVISQSQVDWKGSSVGLQ